MRSGIRFTAAAMLASLCLLSQGCNYRSTKDTYYLVAPNLKLPYWKSVQDGFQTAAHQYGVTAVVKGPETYDPAAEASAFSDAVASHPLTDQREARLGSASRARRAAAGRLAMPDEAAGPQVAVCIVTPAACRWRRASLHRS